MKTFKLIKFETAPLAGLCAQDAIRKVDRDVRRSLEHVEKARTVADITHREYMKTDPSDVRTAAELRDRMDSYALYAKEQIAEIDRYIESQMALFAAKKLDPQRAYREAIIPTGETLPNGTPVFRIIARNVSLEPEEVDRGSGASVRASVGYGDRIGLADDQRRGKYNDAHLLIEQSTASVDPSEVVPFAQACM